MRGAKLIVQCNMDTLRGQFWAEKALSPRPHIISHRGRSLYLKPYMSNTGGGVRQWIARRNLHVVIMSVKSAKYYLHMYGQINIELFGGRLHTVYGRVVHGRYKYGGKFQYGLYM